MASIQLSQSARMNNRDAQNVRSNIGSRTKLASMQHNQSSGSGQSVGTILVENWNGEIIEPGACAIIIMFRSRFGLPVLI